MRGNGIGIPQLVLLLGCLHDQQPGQGRQQLRPMRAGEHCDQPDAVRGVVRLLVAAQAAGQLDRRAHPDLEQRPELGRAVLDAAGRGRLALRRGRRCGPRPDQRPEQHLLGGLQDRGAHLRRHRQERHPDAGRGVGRCVGVAAGQRVGQRDELPLPLDAAELARHRLLGQRLFGRRVLGQRLATAAAPAARSAPSARRSSTRGCARSPRTTRRWRSRR